MNVLRLDGCTLTPLASYLKALGILRIVSEQADSEARGWWEGRVFRLATSLGLQELIEFVLEKYEPTPLFNPWGARSGFYSGSSENSARRVLVEIEKSPDPRFQRYKLAITTVRSVLGRTTGGKKPGDDPEGKRALALALRREMRSAASDWLDAVIAVVDTSTRGVEQPALFGTGGSEGSGSYTSAYMAAVSECLLHRRWDHAIDGCLSGTFNHPGHVWSASFGQYLPTGLGTPWDLLFAFEGGCEIRSSVAVRSGTSGDRWLSSPFYVAPASTGFYSASRIDEYALNKGKELPGRGEQWFPVWSLPMTRLELAHLFRDGRAVSRKKRASDGWSMLRAVRQLGVSQGVDSFIRFGYLQRNNQATHFAVPLGRIAVADNVSEQLTCLDDLDQWYRGLKRLARAKQAPSRLLSVESRLAEALYACTAHPDEPNRWQDVLLRLADVEACQVTGTGFRAGPVPRLRPEWIEAADDGSPEFRLAVACALQHGGSGVGSRLEPIRRYWLPVERGRFSTSGTGGQARLLPGPEQVMHGRSGIDDAIALVERRLIEGAQAGERHLCLVSASRADASRHDLAAFLAQGVDPDRTLQLARALMAIDWRAWRWSRIRLSRPMPVTAPDDAWVAIRLALLPWPLPGGRAVASDPAIVRRLAVGDAGSAYEIARQRLGAAGIDPTVRVASVSPDAAKRWAAALAFPISKRTASRFVAQLDPRSVTKEN